MTTVVTVKKEMDKIKEKVMPKRREPIIIKFWDECLDFWTGKPVSCENCAEKCKRQMGNTHEEH